MTKPMRKPLIRAITYDEAGEAVSRLIEIAFHDHGGAIKARQFLLAWWDGASGRWAITDLNSLDPEIAEDILICLAYQIQHGITLPSEWGHRDVMEAWASGR